MTLLLLGACVDHDVTVRLKAGIDLQATERWRGAAKQEAKTYANKAAPTPQQKR